MKKLLLAIFLLLIMVSCSPVRYANLQRKHNCYQRHKTTTYTIPMWIPGRGILLETHTITPHRVHKKKR